MPSSSTLPCSAALVGSKEGEEEREEGMLHVKAVVAVAVGVVVMVEVEGEENVGVHKSKVELTPPPTLPINCPVGDTPALNITTALHPRVGGRRFTPVTVILKPPVGGIGRAGEVASASRIAGEYAKGVGEVMASTAAVVVTGGKAETAAAWVYTMDTLDREPGTPMGETHTMLESPQESMGEQGRGGGKKGDVLLLPLLLLLPCGVWKSTEKL